MKLVTKLVSKNGKVVFTCGGRQTDKYWVNELAQIKAADDADHALFSELYRNPAQFHLEHAVEL